MWAFVIYKTTEIAITNKRIIAKFGFISRRTIEINLQKIESIQVDQNVLGRLLDYGTIVIAGRRHAEPYGARHRRSRCASASTSWKRRTRCRASSDGTCSDTFLRPTPRISQQNVFDATRAGRGGNGKAPMIFRKGPVSRPRSLGPAPACSFKNA